MLTLIALVTAFLAVVTLLPLWRNEHWLVRSMDFPRLQFLVLLVLLIAFQLLLLDLSDPASVGLLAVALLCLVYQSWWIIPYSPLFPCEVKSCRVTDAERSIAIMTANVLASNRNAAALLALVRDSRPDILVTLESDQWWQAQLDSLEGDYPHSIKCPLDNLYGMHVYSRLPLSDCHTEFLVEDDKPSMHALATLPSGCGVRLHFLHPAPPSPTENDSSSPRDAELIVVGKSVAEAPGPVIVTGDLNDVAWSETTRLFRKISGLLDPRVGRVTGQHQRDIAGLGNRRRLCRDAGIVEALVA